MTPENTPRLETNRLILRKFTETDFPAMLEFFGDKETNTFLPWFPVKNIDELTAFYEQRYAEKYRADQAYAYAVCMKENNVPIGYVHLETQGAHDLGYGLLPKFRGRGIITEACRAVIERAKRNGFAFITATHDINNPKSGKVMKRLGMRYCYSYREQWQPKNISVVFRMFQLNLKENTPVYEEYKRLSPEWFVEKTI